MLTSIPYINQQEFSSPKKQFKVKYISAPDLHYVGSATTKVSLPLLQMQLYTGSLRHFLPSKQKNPSSKINYHFGLQYFIFDPLL